MTDSKPLTENGVKEGFGKRPWVRLWTNEWLDGTTRFQMSDAQRAFWIDLLAMAGRSRFPGVVCAGRDGEQWVGYPLSRFQSLMTTPIDIEATLALFQQTGKIEIEVTHQQPVKLYKLVLLNWQKYQSNLEAQAGRARKYRQNKKSHSENHGTVTPSVTPASRGVTRLEREEDQIQKDRKQTAPQTGAVGVVLPDWLPKKEWNDYLKMRQRMRKPATTEAMTLVISELARLRDAGNDPKLVLEQSILNSWQGIFEPKKGGSNGNGYRAPKGATSNSGRQSGRQPDHDAADGL